MKEKRNKAWLRKLVVIALCLTLTVVSVPCPAQAADSDSKLEVTFLDVGQADAALIQCDGHSMLIDGGNAADSSKMYTVMKNRKITELDYVIGTHAHEDHIGGLAGALNYASVKTAYAPVTTCDSKAFQNFRKAVEKHGVSLTVPKKGETFSLGSAECKILAVNSESDANNTSIVLRITFGDISFLFTGDAERETEQAILSGKGVAFRDSLTVTLQSGSRVCVSQRRGCIDGAEKVFFSLLQNAHPAKLRAVEHLVGQLLTFVHFLNPFFSKIVSMAHHREMICFPEEKQKERLQTTE